MQVQGFKFHQIHLALYDLNVGDLIYDLIYDFIYILSDLKLQMKQKNLLINKIFHSLAFLVNIFCIKQLERRTQCLCQIYKVNKTRN